MKLFSSRKFVVKDAGALPTVLVMRKAMKKRLQLLTIMTFLMGFHHENPGFKGSNIVFQDMIHTDTWEGETKNNVELLNFLRTGFAASGSMHPFTPGIIPRNLETKVLDQRREVAISQSLFGAGLSLLVGVIIWEAEDPCMPLVVALFSVVGMSLKSVVQFFTTIKNNPASDAVALLSFNWLILGTLTYPTLPNVARVLAPLALRFVSQILNLFGVASRVRTRRNLQVISTKLKVGTLESGKAMDQIPHQNVK